MNLLIQKSPLSYVEWLENIVLSSRKSTTPPKIIIHKYQNLYKKASFFFEVFFINKKL